MQPPETNIPSENKNTTTINEYNYNTYTEFSKLTPEEQGQLVSDFDTDKQAGLDDGLTERADLNNEVLTKSVGDFISTDITAVLGDEAGLSLSHIQKTGDYLYGFQIKADHELDIQKVNAMYEFGSDSRIRIEGSMAEGYRGVFDTTDIYDITTIYKEDRKLGAALMIMNSTSTVGGYLGYSKGSEFEKLVVSTGVEIEKGTRVKASYGMFKETLNNSKINPKETRASLELAQDFDKDGFIQEIKGGITYVDLKGQDLGILSQTVDKYGYGWGGPGYSTNVDILETTTVTGEVIDKKALSQHLNITMKLADNLGAQAYFANRKESSEYGTNNIKTVGGSITYDMNEVSRVSIHGSNTQSDNGDMARYGASFEKKFDSGNSLFVKGSKVEGDGFNDSNVSVGIKIPFGGDKTTSFRPINPDRSQGGLSWDDVRPNNIVNNDNYNLEPEIKISRDVDGVIITTEEEQEPVESCDEISELLGLCGDEDYKIEGGGPMQSSAPTVMDEILGKEKFPSSKVENNNKDF